MRIRLLHPEFFTDEVLWTQCSDFAKLVFQGLWLMADREGRLRDNIRTIDGEVLPHDARTATAALVELEAAGRIRRYVGPSGPVIHVVNFLKWQHPHPREKPSPFRESASGAPKARHGHGADMAQSRNGQAQGEPASRLSPSVLDPVLDPVLVPDPVPRRPGAPPARPEPTLSRPSTGGTQEQRRRVAAAAGAKRRASAPVSAPLAKKNPADVVKKYLG